MTFRFLHLADLHLETVYGGRAATRERLREASLQAFERAVDFALERRLDALLIAGDAFDDALLSRRTELFFVRQLRRLAAAGTHALYCCGNHDPGGSSLRAAHLGLDSGDDPSKALLHIFRGARPEVVTLSGRDGEPVGVVVGAGHNTDRESRDLAANFTRLKTGLPVVGLLHCQVGSARDAAEHARYAPASREDLARVEYDYWALGHVHLRQRPFADLPAWYAGNLQGRNARETGPKGGLLVELAAGEPVDPAFVPFAPVRWEHLRLEGLEGYATFSGLLDHLVARVREAGAGGNEELALRLELTGPTPLAGELRSADTRAELEEELLECSGVVEIQLRTHGTRRPRALADLRRTPSVLREALNLCEAAAGDPALLASLEPEVLAAFEGTDALDAERRRDHLASLLEGLDEELLERCLGQEPA